MKKLIALFVKKPLEGTIVVGLISTLLSLALNAGFMSDFGVASQVMTGVLRVSVFVTFGAGIIWLIKHAKD